jgi:hypothetical protein
MAETFTDDDIQSLAHKLTQFNQTLTPGERAALTEVVLRGALNPKEVEGYFDRRDRAAEGAIGAQEGGDPLNPVFNIFGVPSLKGRDRPSERR